MQLQITNYQLQILNFEHGFIDLAGHAEVERAQRISAFAVPHRAIGEQLAAMQQQQAIRDGGRLSEVVSGEQNRSLLPCQSVDRGPEVCRGGGVEAARRLVEQEHAGTLDQGARDPQSLVHAAGKLHDQRVALLFETGIAKNVFDPRRSLTPRDFVEGGKEIKVLRSGETREKRAFRGNGDADLPPDFTRSAPCIEAAHAYRSGIGQEHGRDQLERRGLSAAVRAEQHQYLGASCRERNVFQGNGFAAPLPSKPIEQSWTMAKYLADGLENDLLHESGRRNCERRLYNHETTNHA